MSISKHTHIDVKFEISTPLIEIKNKTFLFEKEIIGKNALNIYNITSRIDNFCSAAHTIASQIAVENAFNITPTKQTIFLREIILKSEIIYSHLSHLFLRITPKLYENHTYFEFMKKNEKEYLKNNESLLKIEKILNIISKRYPHPINIVVGGHFKCIDEEEKKEIVMLLKEVSSHIITIADFLSKHLKYSLEVVDEYSSLWDLDATPLLNGKIKHNEEEVKTPQEIYESFDLEKSYFVGPISRLNNNKKLLSFTAEKLVKKYGLKFPINNPYQTPMCLVIESIHLIEQSIENIQKTVLEIEQPLKIEIIDGKGSSCVESAKGTIYYSLEIEKGIVTKSKIITPIDQNERFLQKAIKNIPFDPDKKTRKQLLDEIDFLIEMFYL